MVRVLSRPLFLMDGDKDDLLQEGMIGLFKAVRTYDVDRETAFETFANLCISRQLYSAIKLSNRQKNIPLNSVRQDKGSMAAESGRNRNRRGKRQKYKAQAYQQAK